MPVKYCRNCSELKDIEMFYKSKNVKSYPDNRINWCKSCTKDYKRKNKKVSEPVNSYRVEFRAVVFDFD